MGFILWSETPKFQYDFVSAFDIEAWIITASVPFGTHAVLFCVYLENIY